MRVDPRAVERPDEPIEILVRGECLPVAGLPWMARDPSDAECDVVSVSTPELAHREELMERLSPYPRRVRRRVDAAVDVLGGALRSDGLQKLDCLDVQAQIDHPCARPLLIAGAEFPEGARWAVDDGLDRDGLVVIVDVGGEEGAPADAIGARGPTFRATQHLYKGLFGLPAVSITGDSWRSSHRCNQVDRRNPRTLGGPPCQLHASGRPVTGN